MLGGLFGGGSDDGDSPAPTPVGREKSRTHLHMLLGPAAAGGAGFLAGGDHMTQHVKSFLSNGGGPDGEGGGDKSKVGGWVCCDAAWPAAAAATAGAGAWQMLRARPLGGPCCCSDVIAPCACQSSGTCGSVSQPWVSPPPPASLRTAGLASLHPPLRFARGACTGRAHAACHF